MDRDAHAKDVATPGAEQAEDHSFTHAFLATFSMIMVSEIGDKTFFIAAIMSMRHPRAIVFAGAMLSLAIMHVLSAGMGFSATIIPRKVTIILSSLLFALFGLKMLKEAWSMASDAAQEEFEEAKAELQQIENESSVESGVRKTPSKIPSIFSGISQKLQVIFGRVFLEAFTLTFLAEWGDRSQIATIILAARENLTGIIFGGLLGHFICTGLAVVGGKVISKSISARMVTFIGGVVFLVFAISTLLLEDFSSTSNSSPPSDKLIIEQTHPNSQ